MKPGTIHSTEGKQVYRMATGEVYTLTRIGDTEWKAVAKWKGNKATGLAFGTPAEALAWCKEVSGLKE